MAVVGLAAWVCTRSQVAWPQVGTITPARLVPWVCFGRSLLGMVAGRVTALRDQCGARCKVRGQAGQATSAPAAARRTPAGPAALLGWPRGWTP